MKNINKYLYNNNNNNNHNKYNLYNDNKFIRIA